MTMDEKTKRPDPPQEIPMHPIEGSSAIAAIGYDEATMVLRVAFHGGDRIGDHFDVPPERARDFLAAESHGKYYNAHIRPRYEYAPFKRPAAPQLPPTTEGSDPK